MPLTLTKVDHGTVAGDGTGSTAFVAFENVNTTFDAIKVAVDLNTLKVSGAFTADGNTLITPTTAIVLNQATGNEAAVTINYTTNKATSGNDDGLVVNQTDTLSPGTSYLQRWQVGGTDKTVMRNNGFIGIGNGDPPWPLTIEYSSSTQPQISIKNSGNATDDRASIAFSNDIGDNTAFIGLNSSTTGPGIGYPDMLLSQTTTAGIAFIASDPAGYFIINTGGTSSANKRMTINSDGSSIFASALVKSADTDEAFSITPIYNQSGTAGATDFLINRTETALGSGTQLLQDWQANSVSLASMDNNGRMLISDGSPSLPSLGNVTQPDSGIYFNGSEIHVSVGASSVTNWSVSNGMRISGTYKIGWVNGNANATVSDTVIVRDDVGIVGFRDGVNEEAVRVYKTYTDASNYQRLAMTWNTSTSLIMNEGAGTGADGSVAFNDAVLATTATKGFIMIPSCAGIPTGVPADIPTGQIPLIFDSVNNKLYVYDAGWLATAALS